MFRRRRKSMKPNKESLEESLRNRYKLTPSEVKLQTIEVKAIENLKCTIEKMNREMKTDTDLFLAGSVAEGYSVPVSPAWIKTEGTTNICFMVSPTEKFVSFQKDSGTYHASQTRFCHSIVLVDIGGGESYLKRGRVAKWYYETEFPYYNITDRKGKPLVANRIKTKLIDIVHSLNIDSFPNYVPETFCQKLLMMILCRYTNFADIR